MNETHQIHRRRRRRQLHYSCITIVRTYAPISIINKSERNSKNIFCGQKLIDNNSGMYKLPELARCEAETFSMESRIGLVNIQLWL